MEEMPFRRLGETILAQYLRNDDSIDVVTDTDRLLVAVIMCLLDIAQSLEEIGEKLDK